MGVLRGDSYSRVEVGILASVAPDDQRARVLSNECIVFYYRLNGHASLSDDAIFNLGMRIFRPDHQ